MRTQGVLCKSNHGAPPCVYQDELSSKAAERAQGCAKAAVLMGHPWVKGLVVASVYDQKPFYMITNVATEITWVDVSKKVCGCFCL